MFESPRNEKGSLSAEYQNIDLTIKEGRYFLDVYLRGIAVPESILEKYSLSFDKYDWEHMHQNQELSVAFLSRHKEKFDWFGVVIKRKKYEIEFLESFKDLIPWGAIFYNKIDESILNNFINYIDWNRLIKFKFDLSEAFIEQNINKIKNTYSLDLIALAYNKNIGELFYIENKDLFKNIWCFIFAKRKQKFSDYFLINWFDSVYLKDLKGRSQESIEFDIKNNYASIFYRIKNLELI